MPYRKFSRPQGPRRALLRNQVTSFLAEEKVVTTEAKAKVVSSLAERLITMAAKDASVASRRQAAKFILKEDVVKKLFDSIAPRYQGRPGGYTRILKLGPRRGDAAPMVILELV